MIRGILGACVRAGARTGVRSLALIAVLGGMALAPAHSADLDSILNSRPDTDKARDQFRHPKEVLTLFEVGPGMTVVDALPGGWYGRILTPLIGAEGMYVGASYSDELNSLNAERRGATYSDEDKARRAASAASFVDKVPEWAADASQAPEASYFRIWEAPADMDGKVDRYLMFRAAHHLAKFGDSYLQRTADEAFRIVKPGGIVGIVQHRAPEASSDEWAAGFNGYVKQSRVVAAFTAAGFTLEEASEVNANPKDQPGDGDFVWRLPPRGDATDIGESDRMTLKFRKPAA